MPNLEDRRDYKIELPENVAVLNIDLIKAFGKTGGLPVIGAEELVELINKFNDKYKAEIYVDVVDEHHGDPKKVKDTHLLPQLMGATLTKKFGY